MKKKTYTRHEINIIKSKEPMDIGDEEYLLLFNKAVNCGDIDVSTVLMEQYQDILDRTQDEDYLKRHSDPADREDYYMYPILIKTSRNTERRIENIITYLTGKMSISRRYITLLHRTVPYKEVFNYVTIKYDKDYLPEPLWSDYFLQVPEFKKIILLRSIKDLNELIQKSANYFEQYSMIGRRGEYDIYN